jgi:hypothetical protein
MARVAIVADLTDLPADVMGVLFDIGEVHAREMLVRVDITDWNIVEDRVTLRGEVKAFTTRASIGGQRAPD